MHKPKRKFKIVRRKPPPNDGPSIDEKILDLTAVAVDAGDETAQNVTPSLITPSNIWSRIMETGKKIRDAYMSKKNRSRELTIVRNDVSAEAPKDVSAVASLSTTQAATFDIPDPALHRQAPAPQTQPVPSRWFYVGAAIASIPRITIGAAFASAGAWIAYNSIEANGWIGHAMSVDVRAGDIFSNLMMTGEFIAFIGPQASRYYALMEDRKSSIKGWVVTLLMLFIVCLAASGFVATNMMDKVNQRERELAQTPEVATTQRALDNANKTIDRCYKVNPKSKTACRQSEDDVKAKEVDLKSAMSDARKSAIKAADPQATALGIDPNLLRLIQAVAVVVICLVGGIVFSLGWGLVFRRR